MSALFTSNTTKDPLLRLLNADTRQERDDLTEQWRDHKLQELNLIGVVGGLLASMLSGTGSWPTILQNNTEQPWTVRACWYCGILFAVAAVLCSLQQSVRLHRLSGNPEAAKYLRRLLSHEKHDKENGQVRPRQSHVLVWQAGAYFLLAAALCMIGGMFILIWSSTGNLVQGESWWNSNSKLAVTFSIIAVIIAFSFLFIQTTLYSWQGKDDSEEDNEGVCGDPNSEKER